MDFDAMARAMLRVRNAHEALVGALNDARDYLTHEEKMKFMMGSVMNAETLEEVHERHIAQKTAYDAGRAAARDEQQAPSTPTSVLDAIRFPE